MEGRDADGPARRPDGHALDTPSRNVGQVDFFVGFELDLDFGPEPPTSWSIGSAFATIARQANGDAELCVTMFKAGGRLFHELASDQFMAFGQFRMLHIWQHSATCACDAYSFHAATIARTPLLAAA